MFRTLRKTVALIAGCAMLLGPAAGCSALGGSSQAVVKSVSDIERGSSHDPSIVEANGKYYISARIAHGSKAMT